MKKFARIIFVFFTVCCLLPVAAICQELNPQVTITAVSTNNLGSDMPRITTSMQQQIMAFLTNRRWTNDNFLQSERIDCSIQINITSRPATDQFTAELQINCRRPVFKTGYNTPLFNYNDKDIQFTYIENQPFDFNIQNYTNNITSILAYYAYVMLAFDYDSYSLLGGTEYWKNAQQIVNSAQSSSDPSWQSAHNSFRNRFTLIDNIVGNQMFQPLRESIYNYHHKGLDQMYDKLEDGRAAILASIANLKEVHKTKPASFNMQLFFVAKKEEIIDIFRDATLEEKNQLIEILNLIDPANQNLYSKITQ